MKMIAGAVSFAWLNRSRTRLAPTPTTISMNSDADSEKNGTSASPATARASRVLPVPGSPVSRTPLGDRGPQALKALGRTEELDDFRQLLLDLVDPGHVGERSALLGVLVALAAGATEASQPSQAPAGRRCPPRQQHEQPHEQQGRAEAHEQGLPPR